MQVRAATLGRAVLQAENRGSVPHADCGGVWNQAWPAHLHRSAASNLRIRLAQKLCAGFMSVANPLCSSEPALPAGWRTDF
jgi:hypothetical protein